jgi:hypothetical protein
MPEIDSLIDSNYRRLRRQRPTKTDNQITRMSTGIERAFLISTPKTLFDHGASDLDDLVAQLCCFFELELFGQA